LIFPWKAFFFVLLLDALMRVLFEDFHC